MTHGDVQRTPSKATLHSSLALIPPTADNHFPLFLLIVVSTTSGTYFIPASAEN